MLIGDVWETTYGCSDSYSTCNSDGTCGGIFVFITTLNVLKHPSGGDVILLGMGIVCVIAVAAILMLTATFIQTRYMVAITTSRRV